MSRLIAALILATSAAPGCALNAKANGDSEAVFCIAQADFGRDYGAALQQAATAWNEVVGSSLTTRWGDCRTTDVIVERVDSLPSDEIGFSYEMPAGRSNLIVVRTGLSFGDARAALTHEIGHQLGLGHAPDGAAAIMAPYVDGDSRITDADVAAYDAVRGNVAMPHDVAAQ